MARTPGAHNQCPKAPTACKEEHEGHRITSCRVVCSFCTLST